MSPAVIVCVTLAGVNCGLIAVAWVLLDQVARLRGALSRAELESMALRGMLRSHGIAPPPPRGERIQ